MKRNVMLACMGVFLLAATAASWAGENVRSVNDEVYVVIPRPASTTSVLLSSNQRVYVRANVASIDPDGGVQAAMRQLKLRHNNVYALAVNTQGVARATQAVKQGGRVYLRAGYGTTSIATLASRK
jgi:hypothetical protein